ncbi:hypothetical protein PMIN05_001992 [Paraphaeosphaeria minitans]
MGECGDLEAFTPRAIRKGVRDRAAAPVPHDPSVRCCVGLKRILAMARHLARKEQGPGQGQRKATSVVSEGKRWTRLRGKPRDCV